MSFDYTFPHSWVIMRAFSVLLALAILRVGSATPIRDAQHVLQAPLVGKNGVDKAATRKLQGRFLHITGKSMHPI
jgi:hypothetical protein